MQEVTKEELEQLIEEAKKAGKDVSKLEATLNALTEQVKPKFGEKKTVKEFINMISKDNKLKTVELSEAIGRPKNALGHSLRNDTLKVIDLKNCLKCVGTPLVITYKKKKYEIETTKTK